MRILVCVLSVVWLSAPASGADEVERWVPEILATYPHDTGAFTQGLLYHDGFLYESTGRYGHSRLRQVEPESGGVVRETRLSHTLFAEGLARVEGELWQLTWKRGLLLRHRVDDFGRLKSLRYDGEGWGLCHDGRSMVMSDGSRSLQFRDDRTFEFRRRVNVTLEGRAVSHLNELECVGDRVYANIWRRDAIAVIDPSDGRVTAMIDASGLLSPGERRNTDVLNGIAHVPGTDEFYLTGKLWPKIFRVRFRVVGD